MYTGRFSREGLLDAVLAAAFVVAWSSGFIGATLGTRAASASTLLMWRFVIAVPLLAMWSARGRHRRLSAHELLVQCALGLLSQGAYLGGTIFAVGLGVGAGIVALIAALQPIASAALAGPLLGERVGRRQWLGLAVGLAGVTLVVATQLDTTARTPAWAYALPFAGMAGLVAATLLERRARPAVSIRQGLAIQCTVSAVLFSALAAASGDAAPPTTAGFWVAITSLIALSTVGGYGLYWLNLRRGGVLRVSSLIYLTPPTTLLWGLLMFGQPIATTTIIGLAVCLAGVTLVRRDTPPTRSQTPGRRTAPKPADRPHGPLPDGRARP